MTDTRPADPPADLTTSAHRRTGLITLAALLSAGWATNHFAALVPVLEDFAHISRPGLDAAFGLYALGLLPSLLLGGGVSDASVAARSCWPGWPSRAPATSSCSSGRRSSASSSAGSSSASAWAWSRVPAPRGLPTSTRRRGPPAPASSSPVDSRSVPWSPHS